MKVRQLILFTSPQDENESCGKMSKYMILNFHHHYFRSKESELKVQSRRVQTTLIHQQDANLDRKGDHFWN